MSALGLLSADDGKARALASLGLPHDASDTDVRLELLRVVTWALTAGRRPVHVLRLLNRSLEIAASLSNSTAEPERLRSDLREGLDALAGAGDLAELDGGLWIPAPTRLVEAPRGDHALFVGGLPTRRLPASVRPGISRSGPFRIADRSVSAALSLPKESLSDWARKPPEPLDAWAARILAIDLHEYSEPLDGAVTQLYLPARARSGAPQFKRWVDRYEGVSGRFLARRSRVFGAREYRLGQAVDGRLVRSGAVLAPREARRLMYAFDALAGNPTRARWIVRPAEAVLILTSDLPDPEHRMLGAMGSLELNPAKAYERRWTFNAQYEQVLEVLRELSIEIRDDRKG